MECKVQFFIVSLLFIQTIVKAQEPLAMVAKLTESELSAVLPILKAEVEGNTKAVDVYALEIDRKGQLFLDIWSGKTDPLDWLKQHSKHIIVPPEAKYEPACSRAVSLGGFIPLASSVNEQRPEEAPLGTLPTAIFTLGKEIRSINRQILGETITQESFERFMTNINNLTAQDYADIKVILDKAIGYYKKNGFVSNYVTLEDGPSSTTATFYHPEEEGYITGNIYHLDEKLFHPNYTENVKQCLQHPLGPSIEIRAEFKLIETLFSSHDFAKSTDENTKISLRKAGISDDRYALIKGSLLRVRTDSEYPDAIEIPSIDFTPTTQEEKEIAKTVEMMKRDALARKDNIKIYLKYKTELDPIIDALEKQMGGVY